MSKVKNVLKKGVLKEELIKEYDTFQVKIIQLYYDDDYEKYQNVKEEIITDIVTI